MARPAQHAVLARELLADARAEANQPGSSGRVIRGHSGHVRAGLQADRVQHCLQDVHPVTPDRHTSWTQALDAVRLAPRTMPRQSPLTSCGPWSSAWSRSVSSNTVTGTS